MKFILLHGAFGSPEGNWFPALSEKLTALGQTVIAPRFPVDDWDELTRAGASVPPRNQSLATWLSAFEKQVMPHIGKGEKTVIVAHSLGPVFALHAVSRFRLELDSAIFVSPFLDSLKNEWQFDHTNASFYKTDFDFGFLKKRIPVSYALYSDADPYASKNHSLLFARALDASVICVRRAGHLNSEVNLNEFPLVLELCKSRLDLTLYQRYLAHRKELFSLAYRKGSAQEEVVYLAPEEIYDEGVFHFRNLVKRGFCTFFTGIAEWDTQGPYYEEARRAACRVKSFVRVFIVDRARDLKRKTLRDQIRSDTEAGIQTYLVWASDVRDAVPELDFGIWDDEYLCIVRVDKKGNINEVQLDGRKTDISRAREWERLILAKASRIRDPAHDPDTFLRTAKEE